MHGSVKAALITGYLTAGFISYIAVNAAFESKRGTEVLKPHNLLGLYIIDAAAGVLGASVNYVVGSLCQLYCASNHDFRVLADTLPAPGTRSC